jgi:pimeloyl-ACP methyl ester carboxylesterase
LIGVVALLLALATVRAISSWRDRRAFPPPGELVDIGGRRLHLLCEGDGPGPTVVIEQGVGGPTILWWHVQDAVAQFARVCVYDRAGFQWSDRAPPSDALGLVGDLGALLAAAKVPRPYVLVGHSYGGPLVRLFARERPGDVAGIVLVDTPDDAMLLSKTFEDYNRSLRRMFGAMQLLATFGVLRLAMALKPVRGLAPGAAEAFAAMFGSPALFRQARADSHALGKLPAEVRGPEGFGTLGSIPLSVITHGQPFVGPAAVLEKDWPAAQARLAALSTDSELVVAQNSNHMVNIDEPELVVAAIRRVHAAARDHARLGEPRPAVARP